MNLNATQPAPAPNEPRGWRKHWSSVAMHLRRWIGHDLLALLMRVALAAIFFLSGRTKVEGLITVTPGTYELFRSEYKLPLVPPEMAAHMAAWSEHLFPALLVIGLATRVSAAALLGMTAVIQLFVYPDAWPTHLSWAVILLYLVSRGGGRFAVDKPFRLD